MAAKPPFQPLEDRVMIKPDPKTTVLASGIAISQTAADKERPQKGTVLAVGQGRFDNYGNRIAMEIQVGDEIYFPKSAGKQLEIDKVVYLLIKERDIMGVATTAKKRAK